MEYRASELTVSRQSETAPLRSVILKHAKTAFRSQEVVNQQWKELGYLEPPDYLRAEQEFEEFRQFFIEIGCEILELPVDLETGLDSIYVRDAAAVCNRGVILCNMGKVQRRGESTAMERALVREGMEIAGRISGDGRVEGGDVVWIDPETIAVGITYRTNLQGISQLQEILGECAREVISVPLPHYRGPLDVFHLMSILSPIDRDLLLVYSPLLPIPFRSYLLDRGFQLVEVPDQEFETMGCNVLALGPRRCLSLEGNPITRQRLEAAGVEVLVYRGEEISRKGSGGPTCLTRPLERIAPAKT